MIAKQSTALTVVVGPILDSTGAEYASAVIGDLSISKNGGTLTAMASAATLTYIANGMYTLVTTTGNMDTLGAVQITCNKATYQMPKMERNVVPASVYDAIVTNATNATGGLPTATAAITGLAGVISTYAGGAVASVTGSVGSISGVSFPSNFGSMVINAGNGHVAVVVHAVQAGAYTDAAFSPNWFTAAGLASDAANEIATAVSGIQVMSRLDSMLEDNGSGQFRFDTIALEMAPAGGGGGGTDWTANERTAIRAILGVPTSGTTPTDPTTGILDEIRDKTALITSGSVQTSIPVTAQGQINGPLYIGDDYLTANGRQFDWTIALPTGFVAATSTCKFGMIFEDESGVSQFNLSGTVTDVGGGNVRLRFELPRATTGTLKAGFHRWSTEIVSATGVEITAVAYSDRKLAEWREKQT